MAQIKKQVACAKTLRRQSSKSCDNYVSGALDKSRRRRFTSPISTSLPFRRAPTSKVKASGDGKIVKQTLEPQENAQARIARRQHKEQLWQQYSLDHSDDSRNALWIYYQPLARYLAEGIKAKLPEYIDLDDLISAGNIGLQDAIVKFNPKIKTPFESYCVTRIRGAILDSIRDLDWVPRMIRNKNNQFERVVRELTTKLRREPTDEEVAMRLKMNSRQYDELQQELDTKIQISVKSGGLNSYHERNMLRLDMFETPRENEPSSDLQREEIRKIAFHNLTHNERFVLEQYYFRGHNLKQIGNDLMLSESRICQIHAKLLIMLKRRFSAYAESCEF